MLSRESTIIYAVSAQIETRQSPSTDDFLRFPWPWINFEMRAMMSLPHVIASLG